MGRVRMRWRWIAVGLVATSVLAGVIALLYWAIGPSSDHERNEFTRTVAQILGGAAFLASLYVTFQNLKATQASVQVNTRALEENQKANRERERQAGLAHQESQQANRERERLTQEANLTERYAKAVEMLASDKLEIKLGAIYALERLARDSERDHPTIMELLTAYIREHSPVPKPDSPDKRLALPLDIRAIVDVIRRRTRWFGAGENDPFDLRLSYLVVAQLSGAHLESADLRGADLRGADLREAKLRGTNFSMADLSGVDLRGADLRGAKFGGADLRGADLREAVGFTVVQLSYANTHDGILLPDYFLP